MTTFKSLNREDVISTRTLLHEAIPLTGTIVSGTYNDDNIKNYAHGMFQSVFDYPFLSSSANHIFDITVGYANSSDLSGSSNTQNSKKINQQEYIWMRIHLRIIILEILDSLGHVFLRFLDLNM